MSFLSDNPRLRPILKNLPAPARAKVTRMDKDEAERIAKNQAKSDHLRALQDQSRDLQVQIARMEQEKQDYGSKWSKDFDDELNDRRAEFAEKKKEIEAVRNPDDAPRPPVEVRRRRAWLQDHCGYGDVEEFLARQSVFARYKSAPAMIKRSGRDALPKLIAESSGRQDAFVDEIISLESAALDVATILNAAMAEIDRMASAGKPDLRGLTKWISFSERGFARKQGRMAWPIGAQADFNKSLANVGQLGTSFVCWLLRDVVRERFEKEIRAMVGEGGPTIAERTARIEELKSKLLEEQRTFERLCCMAEDAGLNVDRGYIHPLARLEIEPIADAPRPEQPERHYPVLNENGTGTSGTPVTVGKFQAL